MAKKEATTSVQFEILVAEMEKHPDVAIGGVSFGSSKANIDAIWEATAKKLNSRGPPTRTASKWRKVWTDYRGRLKKKFSSNNASIRQTGGGPSEYSELTALEKSVVNIINTSKAANPSGFAFGLNIPPNTSNKTSTFFEVSSSSFVEVSSSPYAGMPSSPSVEILSSIELDTIETPLSYQTNPKNVEISTPNTSKKSKYSSRKRRLHTKEEERTKIMKLIEKQTEEMGKMTAALGKLTAAIEAQTIILECNTKIKYE